MGDYKILHKAQLTFEYLHTNSTTHEFLFGALAEMIDNSRDADSSRLDIYSVSCSSIRGNFMLCFLDDGYGMNPDETLSVVSFGRSNKRALDNRAIGQYGNGLKSGSMRIGNDLILFTKKSGMLTCLLLSRSFHEAEGIEEVVVPVPVFDALTKEPILAEDKSKKMHETEMELIFKYSPFKDLSVFLSEFDRISGDSGTLVVIYNMKLTDSGRAELDVVSDPYDVLIEGGEAGEVELDLCLCPERRSLRSYVSVLYYEPTMKVYIQGRKVQCRLLIHTLYRPREYSYASTRYKAKAQAEIELATHELKQYEDRVRETESKIAALFQPRNTCFIVEEVAAAEVEKRKLLLAEQKRVVGRKRAEIDRRVKSLQTPINMRLQFGINVENRRRDGTFVYNCNRLIRLYERSFPGSSTESINIGGVVAVVNVPAGVIEPTHNKQNFADAREYRILLKAIYQHMQHYVVDVRYFKGNQDRMWTEFGYPPGADWTRCLSPSDDAQFVRKRRSETAPRLVQCDKCLKWNRVRGEAFEEGFPPDEWECAMNPSEEKQAGCDRPPISLSVKKCETFAHVKLEKATATAAAAAVRTAERRSVRFAVSTAPADTPAPTKSILLRNPSRARTEPRQRVVKRPRRNQRPGGEDTDTDNDADWTHAAPAKKSHKNRPNNNTREQRSKTTTRNSKSLDERLRLVLAYVISSKNETGQLTKEKVMKMNANQLVKLDLEKIQEEYQSDKAKVYENLKDEVDLIEEETKKNLEQLKALAHTLSQRATDELL